MIENKQVKTSLHLLLMAGTLTPNERIALDIILQGNTRDEEYVIDPYSLFDRFGESTNNVLDGMVSNGLIAIKSKSFDHYVFSVPIQTLEIYQNPDSSTATSNVFYITSNYTYNEFINHISKTTVLDDESKELFEDLKDLLQEALNHAQNNDNKGILSKIHNKIEQNPATASLFAGLCSAIIDVFLKVK